MGDHADAVLILGSDGLGEHEDRFGGTGKLRGSAEAAKTRVVGVFDARDGVSDHARMQLGVGIGRADGDFGELRGHAFGIAFELGPHLLVVPQFIHAFAEVHEIGFAKIGAAEEWFLFGCHEHAHGPAAAAGAGLHKGHVNLVDIRPFFAVEFDADEMLVEQGAHFLILEALALHDVTPVAGGITD